MKMASSGTGIAVMIVSVPYVTDGSQFDSYMNVTPAHSNSYFVEVDKYNCK
jgi:hypothetical protein